MSRYHQDLNRAPPVPLWTRPRQRGGFVVVHVEYTVSSCSILLCGFLGEFVFHFVILLYFYIFVYVLFIYNLSIYFFCCFGCFCCVSYYEKVQRVQTASVHTSVTRVRLVLWRRTKFNCPIFIKVPIPFKQSPVAWVRLLELARTKFNCPVLRKSRGSK